MIDKTIDKSLRWVDDRLGVTMTEIIKDGDSAV